MNKFTIYCKSYIKDLARVKVLAESIGEHNKDNIPFYISCPASDYTKAKTVLNWQPTTSFTELVSKMVENDIKILKK
jgi:GDP-D-mannose dehydratase